MVDAALTGDGFERVAELAAVEVGCPVAIVVPELDVSVTWPEIPAAHGSVEAMPRYPEAAQLIVPVT